jgi:hypothetical protein
MARRSKLTPKVSSVRVMEKYVSDDENVIDVLFEADRGDPGPIARMLESARPFTPLERYYIRNLIERGNNPAGPKMSKAARQKLLSMLRPDRDLTVEERRTLANAFRVGIPRPNHPPPTVAYGNTFSEMMFLLARDRMSRYGETREQAAKAIAEIFRLDAADLLANMLREGGSGSMRREKNKFKKWMAHKKRAAVRDRRSNG